jgi:hypothetical protein
VALPLPPERLEHTETNLQTALEYGALLAPGAGVHVVLAEDQVVEAKRMAAGHDPRSLLALERADADLELALALTRYAGVHTDVLRDADWLRAAPAVRTP